MNGKLYQYGERLATKNKPLKIIMSGSYNTLRYINSFRKNVKKEVDGIKYNLDLSEAIDSSIYYWGGFEHDTIALINKYVKPGDTVIDVGANVGCHTLRFSKIVGKKGKVIAFEPMSWACKKLTKNIALNKKFSRNIIVEKKVISDVSKTKQKVAFRYSWKLFSKKNNVVEEIVDFITLDKYIASKKICKVDAVKIDVDGFEYKVIMGAKKSLKKFRPVIIIELGEYTLKDVGDSIDSLLNEIYDLNYEIIWEKDCYKFKNKKDVLRHIPKNFTINVICLPKK